MITSGGLERIFEIVCRHEPEQGKLIKRADEAIFGGDCGSNHRLRKWKARLGKNLGGIRMTKKQWWGDEPSMAMELGAVLIGKQ